MYVSDEEDADLLKSSNRYDPVNREQAENHLKEERPPEFLLPHENPIKLK